jgi:SAM-dependent methyltransferase
LESLRDTPAADWFEGPLGARVLREEAALAPLALDDVFGFELLQVGAWGPARHLLDGARTQHTTLLAPEMSSGVTLCAPLDSLPFRSDSIDAIFLPHTLELVDDPYAVLREAERVLCAEGCLMICGFNPFSGWGLRRTFAKYVRRPVFPPRTQRLLSERRLRDWVALLGFDVDSVYGYLGLLPSKGRLPRAGDAAAREAPAATARETPAAAVRAIAARPRAAWAAGAYLLKARKRVQTMTLVRPRRRVRQRVLVGAAEPTSKVRP